MRFALTLLAITLLAAESVFAAAAGKYTDGRLTVALSGGDSLTGTLRLGANDFPATAQVSGNSLNGSFTAGGNSFPFTAALDGDTLTLSSGARTYTLKRVVEPVNPLAAAAGATGAAAGGPIAGYAIVNSTDFGKAMFAQKPDVQSVKAALAAAIPDLAHYFDNPPQIKGAYEDSKNHQSGGAIFAATLNGAAMKGVISCKLLDHGAGVTVTYCRADAPQGEWAKLAAAPSVTPPPAPSSDAPAAAAAAAAPPDPSKQLGDNVQILQFADGTGSIAVPDGWTTNAQSALDTVALQGPADQNVFIGSSLIVYSHDSWMVKTTQQNQQRARMMGMAPMPAPQLFIAELTDPVQAMNDLWPQISVANQKRGGPAIQLDQIVEHKDIPCALKGGKAAVITYDVTRTINGISRQYRGAQRVTLIPVGGGMWTFSSTGCTAPRDAFKQDAPQMFAIMQSEKLNQAVCMQRQNQMAQQQMSMIQQQGQAQSAALQANHDAFMQQQQARFDTHEAQMAQTQAGYDAHNQQFRDDMVQRSRNKDDVVEQIQGYRQVYDTQTGLSANVDLNDVNGVVNSLNQAALDPNRYVQIPLRDLQDPR